MAASDHLFLIDDALLFQDVDVLLLADPLLFTGVADRLFVGLYDLNQDHCLLHAGYDLLVDVEGLTHHFQNHQVHASPLVETGEFQKAVVLKGLQEEEAVVIVVAVAHRPLNLIDRSPTPSKII